MAHRLEPCERASAVIFRTGDQQHLLLERGERGRLNTAEKPFPGNRSSPIDIETIEQPCETAQSIAASVRASADCFCTSAPK